MLNVKKWIYDYHYLFCRIPTMTLFLDAALWPTLANMIIQFTATAISNLAGKKYRSRLEFTSRARYLNAIASRFAILKRRHLPWPRFRNKNTYHHQSLPST